MEIEVKARLRDRNSVIEKLKALGCRFSEVKTQDDMVWVEKVGTLEGFLSNKVFLRLRVENGKKTTLTAKISKSKQGSESLIKHEHEVAVSSAEEARGILSLMELQEAVRVIKKRQSAHYKNYEVCIDKVQGLGDFIELERIAPQEDAPQIQKEMLEFLTTLGISQTDHVKKGYDILLLENDIALVGR